MEGRICGRRGGGVKGGGQNMRERGGGEGWWGSLSPIPHRPACPPSPGLRLPRRRRRMLLSRPAFACPPGGGVIACPPPDGRVHTPASPLAPRTRALQATQPPHTHTPRKNSLVANSRAHTREHTRKGPFISRPGWPARDTAGPAQPAQPGCGPGPNRAGDGPGRPGLELGLCRWHIQATRAPRRRARAHARTHTGHG